MCYSIVDYWWSFCFLFSFFLFFFFEIECRYKISGPDGSNYWVNHEAHGVGGSDIDDVWSFKIIVSQQIHNCKYCLLTSRKFVIRLQLLEIPHFEAPQLSMLSTYGVYHGLVCEIFQLFTFPPCSEIQLYVMRWRTSFGQCSEIGKKKI